MTRGKRLTAAEVRTVRTAGRYGDGRGSYGLSLLVQPMRSSGRISKTWSQRLRWNGKPFNIGLGPYPLVSLQEAREMAFDNARAVRHGEDPRKRKVKVPTFERLAAQVIASNRATWKGDAQAKHWESSLRRYVFPTLGDRPVSDIETADVLAVLEPIWIDIHKTAKLIRQRIAVIMDRAIGQGYRADNPASASVIHAALPKVNGGEQEHFDALPYADVGTALTKLEDSDAMPGVSLCLKFLILTATRNREAAEAEWSEIDLDAATWTVPGQRMKNGREHRVPLSRQALAVLWEADEWSDGSGYVFANARTGKPPEASTLRHALRRLGIASTVHGFRSSFAQWAAERTEIPREVVALALAHANRDRVEAAYQRSDLFERRRQLMEDWAAYLS